MIKSRKWILIALIFPIVSLLALTGYKKYVLSFGKEVTLPITGFDPRDLLSGHYIIYSVQYGVEGICKDRYEEKIDAYVCLDNKTFSYSNEGCSLFIAGSCNYGTFNAGIERFYIPESRAQELDQIVRGGSGSIVISISSNGAAQVKDLLISGKSWKD